MPLALPHVKSLLKSLRENKWYITAFPMDNFYGHSYAVVFEDLRAIDKGSRYFGAELTFMDMDDDDRVLSIRANAYGFNHPEAALDFFGVSVNGRGKHPEYAIYNVLNPACPPDFKGHPENLRNKIVSVVNNRDRENGDGTCCYAAKRNGLKADGTPMRRTEFNSAKTRLLRPTLFDRLGADEPTISFCYKDHGERTDAEIIHDFCN